MKSENHLVKAKRLYETQKSLDPNKDWETIIEDLFGASLHYTAYICERKMGMHMDTHKGLIKFLRANDMSELAVLFSALDVCRTGTWYGSRGNGDVVKEARKIIDKFKEKAGELHE